MSTPLRRYDCISIEMRKDGGGTTAASGNDNAFPSAYAMGKVVASVDPSQPPSDVPQRST